MSIINQYITFLNEYRKLLERGVKNIFASSIINKFIWVDDISKLTDRNLCDSFLPLLFRNQLEKKNEIFSLKKPVLPQITIPENLKERIVFNEAKHKFEYLLNETDLVDFTNSEFGKREIEKIKDYEHSKSIYSKLYRASNDIENDSNIEIVLSIGLFQYSKLNHNSKTSLINQHLFHFPLSIEITTSNVIKITFSDSENPYSDFFFLNNTPIEKNILNNIINAFETKIDEYGSDYIFDSHFETLISNYLQQLSDFSIFEDSILRPQTDTYKVDNFRITYSPAINIKGKKPRFFEKLTEDIKKRNETNDLELSLFNLLIRNPENTHTNLYSKPNYFIEDLYENNKEHCSNLNSLEDFSVFFPLPFNKEQKQIYENYLKNRLTVVTGPPGTGKSHTIVNILCSLLAQGKKVLVTAQTDKALESLLTKIPSKFDALVFTKIQLENDKTRFSLENSINNISHILTDNFTLNIKNKIVKLNEFKGEYVKYKSEIFEVLNKEYSIISLNDSFKNLRSYKIFEILQSKDSIEWQWIQDDVTLEMINAFENIYPNISNFINLSDYANSDLQTIDVDFNLIIRELNSFDFETFVFNKNQIETLKGYLNINNILKEKLLKIDLNSVIGVSSKYKNSDIVIKNNQEILRLKKSLIPQIVSDVDLTTNRTYSEIISNLTKYLGDIESYLAQIEPEKNKVSFFNRISSKYKEVKYLEKITLNGTYCDNKENLLLLKKYLLTLGGIDSLLRHISEKGFVVNIDESSSLNSKKILCNKVIEEIDINHSVLSEIETNKNIFDFIQIFNLSKYDIEAVFNKANYLKDEFENLQKLEQEVQIQSKRLRIISETISNTKIKNSFDEYIPFDLIISNTKFEELKRKVNEINDSLQKEIFYCKAKMYLQTILPNTINHLMNVPKDYITKESFEFAYADNYLKSTGNVSIQKAKENLKFIKDKIFDLKCEILFDLAKYNFKNRFNENEINDFINLLENYKINLFQGDRGIRNNVQFQILARKNSTEISKQLSCWVMKFNDVLNSVGSEPEIFDCIIVDEASQLDFNSLLLGYYTKNIIIVGDDKQTSPSSLMGADGNDFESIKKEYLNFLGDKIIQIRSDNSLFSLSKMVAGTANLGLREHFRSVPEIIEFSKSHFYDNTLRPLKQINTNRLKPIEAIFVKNGFVEDKINYSEIEAIQKYLMEMLNNPIYENKTIGVVSLGLSNHTTRLKDIKEDLSYLFGKEKITKHNLIIEDSPKFQGDERDIMIVSLGVGLDLQKSEVNENPKPRAIISDPDELKKINVALSRAKEQMILFHSVKSEDLRENDFRLKILKFFYEDIKPIPPFILPNDNEERSLLNVPNPFDSWFEYDITKELINKGFKYIVPQYKVKENETFYNHHLNKESFVKFKLDIVVFNNGKSIAIECDGDPFHSLPEDIAYDIERQEFLERVGWKVYRILYSDYKRNPANEISKAIDFINKHSKKDEVVISENKLNHSDTVSEKINTDSVNVGRIKEFEQINYTPELFPTEVLKISPTYNDATQNANIQSTVLRYLNINENGTYRLQHKEDDNALFSIPIKKEQENGFLLQCYNNGHINKVYVKTLLEKKLDYLYSNGKNPNSDIIYLKVIESDTIFCIKYKIKSDIIFKAHHTSKISNRDLLHLQGYKVMYNEFNQIEYKILPMGITGGLKRLIFDSFTASGKPVTNNYYEAEWKIIKQFLPNLYE